MAEKKEKSDLKAAEEQVAKAVLDKPKRSTKKTNSKKSSSSKRTTSKLDKKTSIGIEVKAPEGTCTDSFCPFHGTLPVRGQILEGKVVSDKMQRTAVVKRDYMRKNQKYERLEKRSNKYVVHNPPCLGIEAGDNVKIMECRPLSKMVSFVIIEKM